MSEKIAQKIHRLEETLAYEIRRNNQQDAALSALVCAEFSNVLHLSGPSAAQTFLTHLSNMSGIKVRMNPINHQLIFGEDKIEVVH